MFYTRQPNFPTAIDFNPSNLTAGLSELALGYATALNITDASAVRGLAASTPFSFLDTNRTGRLVEGDPTGPFPVLAEISVGRGTMILFSSPASLTNSMINLGDNALLLQNVLKAAPPGAVLLDQTHSAPSPFTGTVKIAQETVAGILQGNMPGSIKLGLALLTLGLIAVRYGYRKPEEKREEKSEEPRPEADEIEEIVKLHPTWRRRSLEYVKRELEVTRKWRDLSFEEE